MLKSLATVTLGVLLSAHHSLASNHVELELVASSGLNRPVFATAPSNDPNHLYIAEHKRQSDQTIADIKILDLETGQVNATPFLTISGLAVGTENGLLGMAFHPDFETNRKFYLHYTTPGPAGDDDPGHVNIVEYETFANDPTLADPGSAKTILRIPQQNGNHNSGWIGFNPKVGPNDPQFLHITIGDGGGPNDPGNDAQTISNNLLGKLLRVDVNVDDFPNDPDRNYGVPAQNPFVGAEGDDEIWLYGVRNVWRASFDRETGDLYFGDVGQATREEINFQPANSAGGENYGWRLREGLVPTPTPTSNPVGGDRPPGSIDPIIDFEHPDWISITGGYVYRGPIQELQGQYFFADFFRDHIMSLQYDPDLGQVTELIDWTQIFSENGSSAENISSFAEDAVGNLYILDYADGEVFKIVPEPVSVSLWISSGLLILASRRRP